MSRACVQNFKPKFSCYSYLKIKMCKFNHLYYLTKNKMQLDGFSKLGLHVNSCPIPQRVCSLCIVRKIVLANIMYSSFDQQFPSLHYFCHHKIVFSTKYLIIHTMLRKPTRNLNGH